MAEKATDRGSRGMFGQKGGRPKSTAVSLVEYQPQPGPTQLGTSGRTHPSCSHEGEQLARSEIIMRDKGKMI